MILETHKFNLAKGGKRGTVLCDLKAAHRFTMEGDTYNVHYTGSASLSLQANPPLHDQINELKSEYLKELKVGSLKPVAVFKNDKELYSGYDRKVDVAPNGKHKVSPDTIGVFQWIALNVGG
jgi:hypothetical protein